MADEADSQASSEWKCLDGKIPVPVSSTEEAASGRG